MVLRVIGLLSHSLPGSRSLCQPRRHAQCYPADRQAACLAAALALHLRDLPPQHSPSQQPRKVGNSLALPLLRVCERPPSHLVNRINASGNCRREQFKQLQHFTYRYKLCEKAQKCSEASQTPNMSIKIRPASKPQQPGNMPTHHIHRCSRQATNLCEHLGMTSFSSCCQGRFHHRLAWLQLSSGCSDLLNCT